MLLAAHADGAIVRTRHDMTAAIHDAPAGWRRMNLLRVGLPDGPARLGRRLFVASQTPVGRSQLLPSVMAAAGPAGHAGLSASEQAWTRMLRSSSGSSVMTAYSAVGPPVRMASIRCRPLR
jgi:hypothetical protein